MEEQSKAAGRLRLKRRQEEIHDRSDFKADRSKGGSIDYAIERIVDDYTQLVVIGTGEADYENMFRHFAWKYGDRISANICYSDDLAHKLYASADAFLMPSRFEPCGLTQLISYRYGTVPIVRETGGLKDTVVPYNEYTNQGEGFSFANYNAEEMLNTINYSKYIFFEKKRQWNQMVERGMNLDYSWKNPQNAMWDCTAIC